MMDRNKLIAFAMNFASFLVERISVKSIILFGSVAKNSFDEESDIDLFIEADNKDEKRIISLLELYKRSREYDAFRLTGIKNEISIKCGNLSEWKNLGRSIISGGLVLYGAYQSTPQKLKHKVLFLLRLENIARTKKIKIWRKIYGYKQKVGKKTYVSKGMVERRLGRGDFIVSIDNSQTVVDYLRENKIRYSFFDIWVD